MKTHSLIKSLLEFKGNARGCVYSEPLNGIPVNLYTPYVSVYMLALGVADSQIGLIVSIGWVFQLILAVFSGVITDKLGRRLTTLIFDLLCWTAPALISALAQNFWFFLAAALFSAFTRIAQNSWMCLMIEDAQPGELIDIFTWVYIAGMLSAFFAPLAGVMIKSYTLITAMRIIYIAAAISYTIKAIITYHMTGETQQGLARLQATRETSLFASLGEYKGVINDLLRAPRTLYTAGIMVIMSICLLINNTFWSIIATEKIRIPAENIALFPFVKSVVMLLFFFVVIPRLRSVHFKLPLMLGFVGFIISQAALITAPVNGYALLLISVLLDACSLATINPLLDRLTVLTIDPKERARIQSLIYVGIILITSPFGWIAGTLSSLDKSLPFVLNIVLFAVGGGLVYLAGKASESPAEAPTKPELAES